MRVAARDREAGVDDPARMRPAIRPAWRRSSAHYADRDCRSERRVYRRLRADVAALRGKDAPVVVYDHRVEEDVWIDEHKRWSALEGEAMGRAYENLMSASADQRFLATYSESQGGRIGCPTAIGVNRSAFL